MWIDTDLSGERRLLACWFRQLAETIFSESNFAFGDFLLENFSGETPMAETIFKFWRQGDSNP